MKLLVVSLASLCAAATCAQNSLDHQPTLYVMGYAHLDTEWRWSYLESVRDYLPRTLQDNFKLIEKYPDYVFNFTGSNRYRLMKEYFPEDYKRMSGYIAKGRWFPGGSSVEEGDVNSPSLESLIRQVLYGNRYFKKEFGKESSEYMLPDCFGFPAALPSILAHCGIKGFSTQKLTWGSAVGIPFNLGVWEGPDGHSVVAALNAQSYGSPIKSDLSNDAYWLKRVSENGAKTGVFADYHYYGTGDMGGAPDEPSVVNLEKSLKGSGPLKVIGGASSQLFDDLTGAQIKKLPIYKGDLELTQHSAGSLTSQAEMKRLNHENEKLAKAAEAASTIAHTVAGLPYPHEKLREAWGFFLPGQFHDLMAGTALPRAYELAWNDQFIAQNEFASVLQTAVGGVAQKMDTRAAGVPVVLFNPTSYDREDPVDLTVNFPTKPPRILEVTGPAGEIVDSQELSRNGSQVHLLARPKITGLGFAVLDIHSAELESSIAHSLAKDQTLENENLKVHVNDAGDVDSILDKRTGQETLAAPIRLAFLHENPKEYPAWNMDWSDQQKPPYAYLDGPSKISVVENGAVRGAIQIERSKNGSRFVQQVRLSAGAERVEFFDKIDWRTSETALKVSVPTTAANEMSTYNEQIGTIKRGNNDPKKYEVSSHQWFDLTDAGGSHGASILTVDKFGSDKPSNHEVRLTLLYTPGVQGGYEDQASQDWGHHEILYGIAPHARGWQAATPQEASELDEPVYAFQVASHPGTLGKKNPFLASTKPNVSIESLKEDEDGKGLIVRLRENSGSSTQDPLSWTGVVAKSFIQVDGQEREIGEVANMNLSPYEVKSYRLAVTEPVSGPAKSHALQIPFNTNVVSSGCATLPSIPADQWPSEIQALGIRFEMGSNAAGSNNAVKCQGQQIALPAGTKHLFVLAAGVGRTARFLVGDKAERRNIGASRGFIGQWDNRVWKGNVDGVAYSWTPTMDGLIPAFLNSDPLAFVATHLKGPKGDLIYEYGYLFAYQFDIPAGTSSFTLPNDPSVLVYAASATGDDAPLATLATPTSERFDTKVDAPVIEAASNASDATLVTLHQGFYGQADDIRVSLNGKAFQAYSGPFWLSKSAVIRTRMGSNGPSAEKQVVVNDSTKPHILKARAWVPTKRVRLSFSEPIRGISDRSNFLSDGPKVVDAKSIDQGTAVELTLDRAPGTKPFEIKLRNLVDISPQANALQTASVTLNPTGPVISGASWQTGERPVVLDVPNLPLGAGSAWTLAFDVKMDAEPASLTPIVGFGESDDAGINGGSRYVCQFDAGIHFWGRNVDIDAGARFKLGTWQRIQVTYDGKLLRIFRDGKLLSTNPASFADAKSVLKIAPLDGWDHQRSFKGEVKNVEVWDEALP